jgi:hypothetical protein
MAFESGPHLQAALICERVLEEKDGVLSFIRVYDRIAHTIVGAGLPDKMPPFDHELQLVIMLKSGVARGNYNVKIMTELPSGLRQSGPSIPVLLEGEDRGQNIILRMNMRFEESGLYWFDVYFDDSLMTRVPLRVVYLPTMIPGPQAPR